MDEADSVLIDEARVPLIIAGRTDAPVDSKYELVLSDTDLSWPPLYLGDARLMTILVYDGGPLFELGTRPPRSWRGPSSGAGTTKYSRRSRL